MNTELSYDQAFSLFRHADSDIDPAEAQGIICGIVCATGNGDADAWLSQIIGEDEFNNLSQRHNHDQLKAWHNTVAKQILSDDFEVQLMLPDDEDALADRIDALSDWCQGFLFGLSMCGIRELEKLPHDAKEIMHDILQISNAGYDSNEDEEHNEAAYTEIVEYLRVGMIVILNELNPSDGENTTVH